MDCCVICLEVSTDPESSIYIDSLEWQKFNIRRLIEKHLWWWHLQQLSLHKCAYICGQCWTMLSSFHLFYLKVKKLHQQYDVEKWPILKGSTAEDKCCRQDTRAKSKIMGKSYKKCIANTNGKRILTRSKSFKNKNCLHEDANAIASSKKSKPKSETSRQIDEYMDQSGYQFYCDLCNIALISFTQLKMHYRLKHDVAGYALCCNRKFYNRPQFTNHLRSHENRNYFKCSSCSKVLSDRLSFENHVKSHKLSVNQIFDCDKCKESFGQRDDYDRHILLHSPHNPAANAGSSNISKNTDKRNDHTGIEVEATSRADTLPNVCSNYSINVFQNTETEQCFPLVKSENITCSENVERMLPDSYADASLNTAHNRDFVSENTEIQVISRAVKSESFVCSENGEIFNYTFVEESGNCSNNDDTQGCEASMNEIYENSLALKTVTFENVKTKNRSAQICKVDEEYLRQANYKVSCHICMTSFTNFLELKSHCRLQHNANGFAMCCNEKMYNAGQFADHLRVHENPNCFMCTICDRVLRHRIAYENHIQSHHKAQSKEVCCDICGKKFSEKAVLYRHQNRMHSNEMQKEQICIYCSNVSPNMRAHRAHIRYNHTKGLRHACHLCEKKFNRPCHLREHLSTHTGVPLYACPYCSRPFKSKANMHTHRKRVHPKEWQEGRITAIAAPKSKKISLGKKKK